MMSQMRIFVSHSHQDNAFCHALVKALRSAGADVWYDEHDMGSGRLGPTIERELRERPIFVVILSPAALRSPWVEDETRWAYCLLRKDTSRIIQPVTAATVRENDVWLFLQDFKRIEASGCQALPLEEAVRRTLRALAFTTTDEAPTLQAAQPAGNAEDLIARGKALNAQGKHIEALPLFTRATHLAPQSFDAWVNLGYTLNAMKWWPEAMAAHERAITLDSNSARAWNNKGWALIELKRTADALVDIDRALALDPAYIFAWNNKGIALVSLSRNGEALVAYERVLDLDPNQSNAWIGKGVALRALGRDAEALVAYDRALSVDADNATAWSYKGTLLMNLARYTEALAAFERALAIDETARRWEYKATALRALGRTTKAEQAERRAKELGG